MCMSKTEINFSEAKKRQGIVRTYKTREKQIKDVDTQNKSKCSSYKKSVFMPPCSV